MPVKQDGKSDEKRRVPAALARFSRTALKAGGNLPDDFSAALFGSLSPIPFQRAPPWFSEVLKIAFRSVKFIRMAL